MDRRSLAWWMTIFMVLGGCVGQPTPPDPHDPAPLASTPAAADPVCPAVNATTPCAPVPVANETTGHSLTPGRAVALRPTGIGWQMAGIEAEATMQMQIRLTHDDIDLCAPDPGAGIYDDGHHTALFFWPGLGRTSESVSFTWWGNPYSHHLHTTSGWDCQDGATIAVQAGATALLAMSTSVEGYTIHVSGTSASAAAPEPKPWPLAHHPGLVFEAPTGDDTAVHSSDHVSVDRHRTWSRTMDTGTAFASVMGWQHHRASEPSAYAGISAMSASLHGNSHGTSMTGTPLPFVDVGPSHYTTSYSMSSLFGPGEVSMIVEWEETAATTMAHDAGAIFVVIPLHQP